MFEYTVWYFLSVKYRWWSLFKQSCCKIKVYFLLSLNPKKSKLCQFWVFVTLKPFRISQNWPQKYLIWVENYWSTKFWAERNSCEYIIVTQIWHVIGSWPPKNGKISQNSTTYKFQITYDRKLKFSGFFIRYRKVHFSQISPKSEMVNMGT